GRGDAFAQPAGHVHAHDFWREKINRLAKHSRFRFDPAHTPADDAESVNHRRMRVSPDERVWEKYFRFPVSVFRFRRKHSLREVLQIHLVNDPDAGRDESEGLESLLAPFQELVTLAIALELHLHVQLECLRRAGEIHLDGVIDDEIDRHQRLDDLRIAAKLFHRAAHRGQIDHEWDAGEILEND